MASLIASVMFVFFQQIFPLEQLGFSFDLSPTLVFLCVIYVFIAGFVFATITGFFSGMVGVSASPGSSVIIAGMLLVAWLILTALNTFVGPTLSSHQIKAAEAITIIIGSVVTGIAAIANDNLQDLKVGQLLGATPWKQQVMLLLGVVVAALVIPPIMQLLFNVYGIAGVLPREGMDPALSLPAPPAALMAAITRAVFRHGLPWNMLLTGIVLVGLLIPITAFISKRCSVKISVLGIAIGMYLPMSSSIPLFIGGLIAYVVNKNLKESKKSKPEINQAIHRGLLLACGLVAGASLMDVLLAIPFSIAKSPDLLKVEFLHWQGSSLGFALLTTAALSVWFYRTVIGGKP